MKTKFVWALLFVVGLQNAAVAQEYAGNWWVNPQTRNVEAIGENSALPRAGGVESGEGDWVEVATIAGGDRLTAKQLRIRQAPNRNPQVIFLGRVRPQLRAVTAADTGKYAADCSTGSLIRMTDAQLEQEFAVPTLPGTVGAALFNWACQ